MRWGQLRPRGTVHLISRLRRQLPLIGEAMDVCPSSLPFQGSLGFSLPARRYQPRPSTLFSHIFSLAREKIGPPEARQKRPRRNEALQARLLILCARFFLSKPQTEFAVWVLSQICNDLSVSAAPSQLPWQGSLWTPQFFIRRQLCLNFYRSPVPI